MNMNEAARTYKPWLSTTSVIFSPLSARDTMARSFWFAEEAMRAGLRKKALFPPLLNKQFKSPQIFVGFFDMGQENEACYHFLGNLPRR